MFNLFNKKKDEGQPSIVSMILQFKPMIEMAGVKLDNVIPQMCQSMEDAQKISGKRFAFLVTSNPGGFMLSIYTIEGDGSMNLQGNAPIGSINDLDAAFKGISEFFKNQTTQHADAKAIEHTGVQSGTESTGNIAAEQSGDGSAAAGE